MSLPTILDAWQWDTFVDDRRVTLPKWTVVYDVDGSKAFRTVES